MRKCHEYHDVLQWVRGRVIGWLEETRKGLEERGEQAEGGWLGTLRWEGHLERVETWKDMAGIVGVVQWVGNEAGRTWTAPYAGLSQKDDDVGTLEDFKYGSTIMRALLCSRIALGDPDFLWPHTLYPTKWIFFALLFNGSLTACRVQETRLTVSLAKATSYFHLPTCWRLRLEGHFSLRQWDTEISLQLGNRTFSIARALV